MNDGILHDRENNVASENHLKDNGQKFNRHCVATLRLLYRGLRLNARQLETQYGMDGRRLRDIFRHRKDCKRQWVKGSDGVTRYVEYWLDIPKPPTKNDLQEFLAELLNGKLDKQQLRAYQQNLFQ